LAEENAAKQMLEDLEKLDPHTADFLTKLAELKEAVLDHAEHEERAEFPHIKRQLVTGRLIRNGLARAVTALAARERGVSRPGWVVPGVCR
jgi:hypothetical protein